MILYMDVYITDTPLFKNLYDELTVLRAKSRIYAMPKKVDITLYTLASYALYKWSNVVIKYELEDKTRMEYFENGVRKIFPGAVIIRGRSDSQKKYQEVIRMLEKMGDEWIFYAGNNDHPFVFSDIGVLEKCLDKAKEMRKQREYVSIFYSHIQEMASLIGDEKHFKMVFPKKNAPVPHYRVIEENEDCYVLESDENGYYCGAQILNMEMMRHWFFSKDLEGKVIRRSDDLTKYMMTKHVLIIPKKQICDHFDGYGNVNPYVGFDIYDKVPPLFIPPGFFEKDVKIAYGYDEYREGWVNINPYKKQYSYRSKDGTDLLIGLKNLPAFWKPYISKIDVNPARNPEEMEALGNRNYLEICDPWPKSIVSAYIAKFVISPIWKMRKFMQRTLIYFKDPEYLAENKDSGHPFFRMYKNALYKLITLFAKK